MQKRTAAVCEHATCPGELMFIETFLVDGLLGDHVAGSKEYLAISNISFVALVRLQLKPKYSHHHQSWFRMVVHGS